MKQLLLTCTVLIFASNVSAFGDRDSTFERKFIIKTSVIGPFYGAQASTDLGFEFSLFNHFRLDTDLGMYFKSPLKSDPAHTTGQYTNIALRYYLDELEMPYYFFGLQYKYDHKQSVVEVDFSDAGYPYKKYIDADRHSNSVLLIAGMQRNFFFDWLMFEYFAGFGAEYRAGRLSGLVDYELEAVNTGKVSDVQWDDPNGKFIPGWTVGAKVGIYLDELNFRKRK